MTSTTPNNLLQTVALYAKADLGVFANISVLPKIANLKFKDFENFEGNLGSSVSIRTQPPMQSQPGLVVKNIPPIVQPLETLTCTQASVLAQSFTAQQIVFNDIEQYIKEWGSASATEILTGVEADVLKNFTSSVTYNDPDSGNVGSYINPSSGPYRFFGNPDGNGGLQPINSLLQLNRIIENFKSVGYIPTDMCMVIPNTAVPDLSDNQFQQFVLDRNERLFESAALARFDGCDFYVSNLLPIHNSGNVGNASTPNNILTLVSTNDPTGQNITQLTFTTTLTNDLNAVKYGDLMQILDDPAYSPIRQQLFYGNLASSQPVQIRSLVDAGSSGSTVVVNIYPALVSAPIIGKNISRPLQAGMKFQVMPSHKAGCLMSGGALFVAMPKLPPQPPYDSYSVTDKTTGMSIRHSFGAVYTQNQTMYTRDLVWGSVLLPKQCMRILFPLNT